MDKIGENDKILIKTLKRAKVRSKNF